MENNIELENLKRELEELKMDFSEWKKIFDFHKHSGRDKSSMIDGNLTLKTQSFITIGNSQISGATVNEGASNEANRFYSVAGKDITTEFADTSIDSQLTLEHQPTTTGSTNQSFYYGIRPPLWTNNGISITNATNTFTDSKRSWTVNALTNAYVNVYDTNLVFKETRKISSNTATVVTVDSNFTFTDSNSTYIILMPVYLGSADYPWRRIYIMEDIRFHRGTSAGTDTIWIKFGSGSPETVVTANIGSLYLRTNGGANTTLYIKESGTGNTGWVAK